MTTGSDPAPWKKLLSLRWILTTLLAIAAVLVLIKLGMWQLDRLAQRRAYNASVLAQIHLPAMDLNPHAGDSGLTALEYRHVTVTGSYDFAQQIIVRNRVYQGRAGMDLLTPLLIDGTHAAVLVDRGWIPLEDLSRERWQQYDEPGKITLTGLLRKSQSQPRFGALDPAQGQLDAVNFITLERIQPQITDPLLPVYVFQTDGGQQKAGYPARSEPVFDLSEGSHESYALQWFTFAAVLAIGYPFYVRKQLWPKDPAGRANMQLS